MHQFVKNQMFKTVFSLAVAAILMVIGCGGGGGGSGRQILPGENPTGPVIITGTGTGTSTGTDTGTGTSTGTDTGTTVEEKLAAGWESMDFGNFGGAILYFESILNDPNATTEDRQQAYNGRGWARVKYFDTLSGKTDFIQAGDLKESLLGYAMALVQQAQPSTISQAVDIFEEIGLGDTAYELTLEHQAIGVTSAEAHAMLAYAYFWRGQAGDDDKAREQILAARNQDDSDTSSVAQIYNTLKKAGLTGI